MKKQILYCLLLFASQSIFAQQYQEISTGAGYNYQHYFNLGNDNETQINNDMWDIAFNVGAFEVGVFINESAGSSQGQPLAAIEVYDAGTTNFDGQPNPSQLTDYQLLNSEKSWSAGALNEAADPNNPLDFGWGIYDPVSHAVNGERVFVVKLRNGQYRKLQVQSLIGEIYTFRYANLDGTDETTQTISKADHAGKAHAYFSFATGATANVEPANGFDLLYCRYITPLYDPSTMTTIPYAVTGILSGNGVEVARAKGVDPTTVDYADWSDSLNTELNTIGYDWKTFTGTAWLLDVDLVYFVKTADNNVWKVQFVDFEGSATGTAVFEKTDLGGASATGDINSTITTFDVFPSPAKVEANLVFSAKKADENAELLLFDLTGKMVFQANIQASQGLNAYVLPVSNLSSGIYMVSLKLGNQVFTKKIIVE
ncbi:MAG: T9SS type A sorting domain-containing protein [Bacteroidetes bacterium]|nr:T9SS type A sorting domain-containing protein [Bacteroidota bacterium]